MKPTISNSLIIISLIFTLVSLQNPEILVFWINNYFLNLWNYTNLFFQFVFYSFLHGWFFHLIFNSIFLYIFWNKVEELLSKTEFLVFFILTTIFNWVFILIFSNANTIWISWFCMALLSFYTLKLYEIKDIEYKWWITAIIVNVLIWFWSQISFIWHLFWAIFWIIYFYMLKAIKKF